MYSETSVATSIYASIFSSLFIINKWMVSNVQNINMGLPSFLLIIVLISQFAIVLNETLNDWDGSSVCRHIYSQRVSRYVPYIETYRKRIIIFWKTLTRYNYRWEYHTEWHTEQKCCIGYQQLGNTCRPICDGNCEHGFCKSPQNCSCDVGYLLSVTGHIQKCLPECAHNCTNGECTAPNTCTCNADYILSSDHYTCLPHCNLLCKANSHCVTPNKCECMDGYDSGVTEVLSNTSVVTCHPICKLPCGVHSSCIAPNVCECVHGYVKVPSESGSMIVTCEPHCSVSCGENSTCTAPESCECLTGFVFPDDNPLTYDGVPNACIPICEPQCPEDSVCASPNNCECSNGYEEIIERDNNTNRVISKRCTPICDPPCGIRGQCMSPDTCSCESGWALLKDHMSFDYCSPYCDPPCGNFSSCVSPNKCSCYPDYEEISPRNQSDPYVCKPICDKKCVNGFCAFPNVCQCNGGYGLDTDDAFNCEPICGTYGCIFGKCTAPDVCTCNDGYQLRINDKWRCDPVCDSCNNGVCIHPNVCICNLGYEKNENDECVPSCYGRCINGTCNAPNQCTCDEGYVSIMYDSFANNSSMCTPYCGLNCDNGACTSPNICTCNYGYEKNNDSICVPSCDGRCEFGNCFAPGQCNCNDGYTTNNNPIGDMCQPYCEFDCINGECLSPNRCECNQGYTIDSSNRSLCIPVCDGGCGHGDCIEPNECQCHIGYVHHENVTSLSDESQHQNGCVNPCNSECGIHGICNIENRTCDCFYGWTGENCDIVSLCGIIRNAGDEDLLQWIADRNGTNDTVGSLPAVNWHGPTCSEKCVLDNTNDTTGCFRLNTDEKQYILDSTFVCFVNSAAWCNSIDLQTSNRIYVGITATIIFIITIAGSAVLIFVIMKRRRQQNSVAKPTNTDNLLEQSEATDSLLAEESSYL